MPPSLSKWLVILLLIIALIGFADATYLTIEHYLGKIPPCTLVNGCQAVTTSRYAVVAGVPIALAGALYYLTIVLLLIACLESGRSSLLRLAARLPIIGFVFSLYLIYLQLFVIHALCIYCLASAISSTLLFILGLLVLRRMREQNATYFLS